MLFVLIGPTHIFYTKVLSDYLWQKVGTNNLYVNSQCQVT